MDWEKIKVPGGNRLIKAHSFMYMVEGTTYKIGIDEYSDGKFTGHGEHSSDESQQLSSVVGGTIEECLQSLIDSI